MARKAANIPAEIPPSPFIDLTDFTKGLIQDLNDLRGGQITLADARARALLAREALRSCHTMIEAARTQLKLLPAPKDDE